MADVSQNRSLNDGRIQPDDDPDIAQDIAEGVRRFLDLSTAHLTPKKFNKDAPRNPAHYEGVIAHDWGEYGWWVWVPDDIDEYISEGEYNVPAEFVVVWRYARERGCDYILFDGDGPVNPDLPILTG